MKGFRTVLFLFVALAVVFLPRVSAADSVPFWVDSRDSFLADWLSVRLKAHGFGAHTAHCAEVIVGAERTTISRNDGYVVIIRVDFLSMDGTLLGRRTSDVERGLVHEDRASGYANLLARLTDRGSYFREVAETAAWRARRFNENPSRTCGSG